MSVTRLSLTSIKKRRCVWSLEYGLLKVVISIDTGWGRKKSTETKKKRENKWKKNGIFRVGRG